MANTYPTKPFLGFVLQFSERADFYFLQKVQTNKQQTSHAITDSQGKYLGSTHLLMREADKRIGNTANREHGPSRAK